MLSLVFTITNPPLSFVLASGYHSRAARCLVFLLCSLQTPIRASPVDAAQSGRRLDPRLGSRSRRPAWGLGVRSKGRRCRHRVGSGRWSFQVVLRRQVTRSVQVVIDAEVGAVLAGTPHCGDVAASIAAQPFCDTVVSKVRSRTTENLF